MPPALWRRWSLRGFRQIQMREASMRRFDLIIVGAGSGNSLIGPEFDELSIALIDDGEWFGGTCLNAGCIPTKMFVHVADVAADTEGAAKFGISASVNGVDWPAIRDRIFGRTDAISEGGLEYRLHGSANVTLYRESFGFEDQHTLVSASGERITAPRIVVAAGSRPRALHARYTPDAAIVDSDSVMRIDALPTSMLIVGGGAIAAELAHVFSALGVQISIVTRSAAMLSASDPDVSDLFTTLSDLRWTRFSDDTISAIDRDGRELVVELASGRSARAEMVLVAIGRVPNTDTLAAASVGFDLREDGRLAVDSTQRVLSGGEPVPGIYALGDISSPYQLKHVANHEARLVEHNLAHPDDLIGADPGPVPAAIFGRPQVASFGLTEPDAVSACLEFVIAMQYYRDTAYGWALEDESSFCKLIVEAASGQLVGAHIVGDDASILIQPLLQAASHGTSVRGLARSQYWPHPALTEVLENALLKAEEALTAHQSSEES